MPNNYRQVPIVLNFGPDGSDPRVSKGMLRVNNGMWTRRDAISKRRPFATVNTSNQQDHLVGFNGSPVTISPSVTINPTNTASRALENAGTRTALIGSLSVTRGAASISGSLGPMSMAELGGYDAIAYIADAEYGTRGLHIDFVDRETASVIKTETLATASGAAHTHTCRLVKLSPTEIYGVFVDGTAAALKYFRYTVSDLEAGTSISTTTYTGITAPATGVDQALDACLVGTRIYIIYADTSPDVGLITSINGDNATKTIATITTGGYVSAVACCEYVASTSCMFAYALKIGAGSDVLTARPYDSTLTPTEAAQNLASTSGADQAWYENLGCARVSDSEVYFTYSVFDRDTSRPRDKTAPRVRIARWSTGTSSTMAAGCRAVSKPFITDSTAGTDGCHVWVSYRDHIGTGDDYSFGSAMLISGSLRTRAYALTGVLLDPYSTIEPADTDPNIGFASSTIDVVQRSGSTGWSVPLLSVVRNDTQAQGASHALSSTDVRTASLRSVFTFKESADYVRSVSVNGTTIVSGSAPAIFDGTRFTTYPFPISAPGTVYATESGSASSSTIAVGTYLFAALYEFTDAAGNRYQSAPSAITSLTTSTGNRKISLSVQSFPSSVANVSIVVYMSQSGTDLLYRVASANSSVITAETAITIDVNPTAISEFETLYTQVGYWENAAPQPFSDVQLYKDRVVAIPIENASDRIVYSKRIYTGEGVAFSTANQLVVPQAGGNIVAIAPWLDKLFILKQRAIYFTEGDGREDNALGSNLEAPIMVNSSVGCETPKSVVGCGVGPAFFSGDIIYRISGGLELEPIGEPVRRWTQASTVTCAFELPSYNISCWVLASGVAVAYNWKYNLWSTWTGTNITNCVDAREIDGTAYLLVSRGDYTNLVKINDAGTPGSDAIFTGAGSTPGTSTEQYSNTLDTGWIQLAEHQRVYGFEIHGYCQVSTDFAVNEAYDFSQKWSGQLTKSYTLPTYGPTDEASYDSSNMRTVDSDADCQAMTLYVPFTRTAANSHRIEISDSTANQVIYTKITLYAKPIESYQRRGSSRRF